MKVAQYEVLGYRSKNTIRPGLSAIVRMTKEERDDRCLHTLVKPPTKGPGAKNASIVPDGTDVSFALFPALRTGLLSLSPSKRL